MHNVLYLFMRSIINEHDDNIVIKINKITPDPASSEYYRNDECEIVNRISYNEYCKTIILFLFLCYIVLA